MPTLPPEGKQRERMPVKLGLSGDRQLSRVLIRCNLGERWRYQLGHRSTSVLTKAGYGALIANTSNIPHMAVPERAVPLPRMGSHHLRQPSLQQNSETAGEGGRIGQLLTFDYTCLIEKQPSKF